MAFEWYGCDKRHLVVETRYRLCWLILADMAQQVKSGLELLCDDYQYIEQWFQQPWWGAPEYPIYIFCRFGALGELYSDQRRNFEAQVFRKVCWQLEIVKTCPTSLHLESDELVEQFHCTLAAQLVILVDKHQRNRNTYLPFSLGKITDVEHVNG